MINILNCILTPPILFKFLKIFYKLYISISFIGATQQFSDFYFHCGRSNALDAEACKRKLKDYGIVRPICQPCITSGKEISVRNAKKMRKWNKHIHLSFYLSIYLSIYLPIYLYTLFRCFIKGSSVLGHLKSKKKTSVLVL